MNKKLFILPLVLGASVFSAQARYYVCVDDFFDTSWIDSMMSSHQRMIDEMKQSFIAVGPSKEDQEAMKAAREKVLKITHSLKEDDSSVTLSFKGFEGLSKDNVKVVKKENGWLGTIALDEGCIEFFITSRGFQVSSCIELKKEEKAHDKDTDTKEEDAKKIERSFYSSSSVTQAEFFSTAVDISTLKAQPIKPDEFTLVIKKQKEELLPLS